MKFVACQQCTFKPGLCHGFEGDWGMAGCSVFNHSKCEKHEWTCVCNLGRLGARVMEVRNFQCRLERALLPIDFNLPQFVPTFYHRFSDVEPLEIEWVAVPLHVLFRPVSGDGIKCLAEDRDALRASLGLHQKTRIMVTGPGKDQLIEVFWRFHRAAKLLDLLKKWDVQLFTVPNYSFFTDAPPLHHHYNRSRILRVAERATEAGVCSVLHLNALHRQTWKEWGDLLRSHSEIKHVCMEFQTGYASPEAGLAALGELVRIQENIQRPLHPILIGAARYAGFIGKHFRSCTIVDAQPFLKTFNRKIFKAMPGGGGDWFFKSTKPSESIIPRFKWNLSEYSGQVGHWLNGAPQPSQAEFGFQLDPTGPLFSRRRQKPLATLPLFGRKQSERTSAPIAVSSSSPSNGEPVAPQNAVERIPSPSTPKSVAILPNSRRKNNHRKLQPNGFDVAKNTGVAGDH